ncbi:hypothetical protein BamMEX5DRAFT_1015 [Burkholderia ambifaria MEX-5]|uniref:GtrA/DPMS transmembrane domain-containing protein n=1 Tax=Burkholderia ambifaria MEX-5 TaxID=396597 RepID=B1SZP9_9BURK|nr:hypothetical protein BamMEX5DRAFT_1015 [Burkholderia ambifaria MEX-5]
MYALLDATQVFANAVAFVCATAFSYLANTLWSFSSTVHSRNLGRYLTVALAGFAEAMLLAHAAELLDVPRGCTIVAIALLIPAHDVRDASVDLSVKFYGVERAGFPAWRDVQRIERDVDGSAPATSTDRSPARRRPLQRSVNGSVPRGAGRWSSARRTRLIPRPPACTP